MFRPFQNFSLRESADFRARRFSLSKKSLQGFFAKLLLELQNKF